jgi:EpsI family protein
MTTDRNLQSNLVVGALSVALVSAAGLSQFLIPKDYHTSAPPNLEQNIPRTIDQWKEVKSPFLVVPADMGVGNSISSPYDEVMTRIFADDKGRIVTLTLAWGKTQQQEVKVHRPELCYPAQGFSVQKLVDHQFRLGASGLDDPIGKRMVAKMDGELELVSYWIRIGSNYSAGAWSTRWNIYQQGMSGVIPDGILVRVSTRIPSSQTPSESDFLQHEEFMKALLKTSPEQLKTYLAVGREDSRT